MRAARKSARHHSSDRYVAGIPDGVLCWDRESIPSRLTQTGRPRAGGAGAGRGGGPVVVAAVDAAVVEGVRAGVRRQRLPPVHCGGHMHCGNGGVAAGGGGGLGGEWWDAPGPNVMPGHITPCHCCSGARPSKASRSDHMDRRLQFTVAKRKRYNEIVTDLHRLHAASGHAHAASLTALYAPMAQVGTKVIGDTTVTAAVKTQCSNPCEGLRSLASSLAADHCGRSGRPGGAGGGAEEGGGAGGAADRPLSAAKTAR